MDIREVVRRIGYFRNKQKISARELSLRIDKHEAYINKLESKDFNLPTRVLLEILEALGVSEEEFFAENIESYKLDKELLNTFKDLTTSQKENLLNFIRK